MILAAITLGFLGSFHCIGMCGPIALALPVHHYSTLRKYLAIALYNGGRLLTYSLLGLLFGMLGQSFFIGGFQQAVSVCIGLLLLVSVIFPRMAMFQTPRFAMVNGFVSRLKHTLGSLFQKRGLRFLFLTGVLNGLLPCGMVYLAIAGAVATGNYVKGAEFMFFFGAGTVPAMFAVAVLGQFVSLGFRNGIRKAMPVMVSLMAVLLIVRGLNLGIPYLSPQFDKQSKEASCCHQLPKPLMRCSPTSHH